MDPSWTLENYHVNATTNVLYQAPNSGSHHHHHRQLPTFHKILQPNSINKSNIPIQGYHHHHHLKYPKSNGNEEEDGVKFWNTDPMIHLKPEFGSRLVQQQPPPPSAMVDCEDDDRDGIGKFPDNQLDQYEFDSMERYTSARNVPNGPFRQRSSLNNVDQYYQVDQRKNQMCRRHSSTTSSILDVPSSPMIRDGNNLIQRDRSPHRRGSIFVQQQQQQPQSSAIIDNSVIASVMVMDDQRNRSQHFVTNPTTAAAAATTTGSNNNLVRHSSPLHQQQQQSLVMATTVTSSSSSSSSSMIMAPFSTQAENRAFHNHIQHNNNGNNNNLHHHHIQQLQFGGLHPSQSMYSSSTSSLQTTSSSSQTVPGIQNNGVPVTSSAAMVALHSSPRKSFNGLDRRRQSSTIVVDESNTILSNDNFDADNNADEETSTSSSFHLQINSPDVGDELVQLNQRSSIRTINDNKNQNDDHNHLHVPNHYINCDDDLLEDDDGDFQQNHRAVRRHRSLPAPTFMSASSSMTSVKQHPRSSSFRIRTNRAQSASRIQEPNGYWRVQVKKSKPYLGIAIEGGSNVTAQSQPRIINIQEDGAANVEGLHVGHIIMEVDGKTTNFMNHGQVAQMIAKAYYNTPEKDYIEFLVREKSRNEFDLRRSSFMLLNSSYE